MALRKVKPVARLQRPLRNFLRLHADDLPPAAIMAATVQSRLTNWTIYADDKGIAAAMRVDPNDWYLCTVKNAAVRPDLRGKGIGKRLYREVANYALRLKTKEGWLRCHVLAADVSRDNVASIKALKRAGFKAINRFCWKRGEKPANIMHFVRMPPTGTKCE